MPAGLHEVGNHFWRMCPRRLMEKASGPKVDEIVVARPCSS